MPDELTDDELKELIAGVRNGDPCYLLDGGKRVWFFDALLALRAARQRERELLAERLLMAKLSAPTPQFYNPLVAYAAMVLRDEILADSGKAVTPDGG